MLSSFFTAVHLYLFFILAPATCHHVSQADLELNEIECEREEEELRKQKEPFSLLEADYDQIQERRRLAEEKRQEELKELELRTKAAICVQAWWRGYSTRKALKNKGKNKKAKKGKGKGKKKWSSD